MKVHGDLRVIALAMLCVVLMIGCSGGGGGVDGSGGKPKTNITGTAAVGAALQNREIIVKGAKGNKTTGTTDSNGKFSIDVKALTAPYILKIDDSQGQRLYSIATAEGVNNIHPFSNLVARNWFVSRGRSIDSEFDSDTAIINPPLETEVSKLIDAFKNLLKAAFQQFSISTSFDFQHGAFDADSTGFDKMLDNMLIEIKQNKITVKLTDPATQFQVTLILDFDLSNDISAPDTQPPTMPTGLAAYPVSDTQIIVVWNPSTDNVGVAGYRVFRDNNTVAQFPISTPFPVFSDTGLTPGTKYCYSVEAFDGTFNGTDTTQGVSPKTTQICATPQAVTSTPPNAITNLTAAVVSDTEISLSWTPSTSTDVIGYDILRGPSGAVTTKIASVVPNSYFDFNLSANNQYCYVVKAFNASGTRSNPSPEVCAMTTNTPPIADAGTGNDFTAPTLVTLNGTNSTDPDPTDTLSYSWFFISKPANSTATLSDPTSPMPTFSADIGGSYVVGLIVNDGTVNSAVATVTYSVSISTAEVEPNDSAATAQMLNPIGLGYPVSGFYEGNSTDDWYGFQAKAGVTYVIELYDVDIGLSKGNGSACDSTNPYGLFLLVQDGTNNEVARQCAPNGVGNVENQAQFTATADGPYYIKVAHNNALTTLTGHYNLRILPRYDDTAAAWDTNQEPNNVAANAFEIQVGGDKAISSSIEARDPAYFTYGADVDWYRFTAQPNTTYVIELYDVDIGLSKGNGSACDSTNPYGLFLLVQDDAGAEITHQCSPNGVGNAENQTQFTASATGGTYFIKVAHNNALATLAGHYKLRILPKYDSTIAAWDANQEPNNVAANAFEMQVGSDKAISSSIEVRNSAYFTNNADVDWYRFTAQPNASYVIELYDVDIGLSKANGSACDPTNPYGLFLFVQDDTGSEVTHQCAPNGVGNVENETQFTASAAGGTYFIKVAHNYAQTPLTGNYKLRILPKYDSSAAVWDSNQEPNNVLGNAYPLQVNANAITSSIEARATAYFTTYADVDWYQFPAVAGTTYTVRLSNVSSIFQNDTGNSCDGINTNSGLTLSLADDAGTTQAQQCSSNGTTPGDVVLTYTPSADGIYSVEVGHNNALTNAYGNYDISITSP